MPKKRSNNPGGRPKEYAATMRTISLSLPEPLLEVLSQISEEVGISRQRIIVEWLMMACHLNIDGYLGTTAEGTSFTDCPYVPTNLCPKPPERWSLKKVAEFYAEAAKKNPDFPDIFGKGRTIKCDEIVKTVEPTVISAFVKKRRKPKA